MFIFYRVNSEVFRSVVVVAFQNTFYSEIHQNNVLKKIFSNAHQKNQKTKKKHNLGKRCLKCSSKRPQNRSAQIQ